MPPPTTTASQTAGGGAAPVAGTAAGSAAGLVAGTAAGAGAVVPAPPAGPWARRVAEVDHVRGGRAPGGQAGLDGALQRRGARTQQGRVDIALHRARPARGVGQGLDRLGQVGALVHAHGPGPGVVHGDQDPGGAGAEVDEGGGPPRRRADRPPRPLDRQRRVGGDARPVVGRGQGSGPGVEQLDGAGPGLDLGGDEVAGQVRAPGHEPVPGGGVGVHEGAGGEVVAAGTALDEVGGQREGRPAEADERRPPGPPRRVRQSGQLPPAQFPAQGAAGRRRRVGPLGTAGRARAGGGRGAELGDGQGHGPTDRPRPRRAVGPLAVAAGGQLGDLRGVAHGRGDDGADPGLDADPDSGQAQRHHDVGEEDGGVDAVAAHRLEGDLGGLLGAQADVEHGGALAAAQRPVLGQGAPGLAHEPHGRAVGALAVQGAQQRRGGPDRPGGIVRARPHGIIPALAENDVA